MLTLDEPSTETTPTAAPNTREVTFEHTRDLASLLERVRGALLVSTYQAGKLATITSRGGRLGVGLHNFERPMGIAVHEGGERIAVAAREQVWTMLNAASIAPQVEPAGEHDACFLTRSSCVTGEIQAHELAWSGDELYVVNTLFSCIAKVDPNYSFVPVWKPMFVSALAAEDRCHLNGLAMAGGRPKYVTAMAQTDTARGWRPTKCETGCLIDVDTNRVVAEGFAMPHSPRVFGGFVWLLDSGRGALVRVDPRDGSIATVARFPGFVRGLTIRDSIAFVGLSKIRETSTFDGVPIAADRDRLKCGVVAVDLISGELLGQFEFASGVDEIFDVALTAGPLNPAVRGPNSRQDGEKTVWLAPPL